MVTIQDVRFAPFEIGQESSQGVLIPGGKVIIERYEGFRAQLPQQARDLKLDHRELT